MYVYNIKKKMTIEKNVDLSHISQEFVYSVEICYVIL